MGANTFLVAVGEEDEQRIDALANAVIAVAAPAEATVVIAHVLTEETYRDALEEAGEETTSFLEKRFGEAAPVQPAIDGDVPKWVKYRSSLESADRPEILEEVLERKKLIRDLATTFEDADVEYEVRGDVGDPAERVIAMVKDVDADFVVVGGRDLSAPRRALFGSVSQKILESVPCPVISVREGVSV